MIRTSFLILVVSLGCAKRFSEAKRFSGVEAEQFTIEAEEEQVANANSTGGQKDKEPIPPLSLYFMLTSAYMHLSQSSWFFKKKENSKDLPLQDLEVKGEDLNLPDLKEKLKSYTLDHVSTGTFPVTTYRAHRQGIHVLAVPVDLCGKTTVGEIKESCIVLYHYTDFTAFANIAHPMASSIEIWSALLEQDESGEYDLRGLKFGSGVYATSKAPDLFESRPAVLYNNYCNAKACNIQKINKMFDKRKGKADFSVAILVRKKNAFNVSEQLPPDFQKLFPDRKPGFTNKGQKLREDRDVWVLQERGKTGKIINASLDVKHYWLKLAKSRAKKDPKWKDIDTITSFSSYADVLAAQGEYAMAELLYRKILKTYEVRTHYGVKHKDTLATMNSLANLLRESNDLHEASKLHNRTYTGREEISSRSNAKQDVLDTLETANDLAIGLMRQDKLLEAEKFARKAFEGRHRALGGDDHFTLFSVATLGDILRAKGEIKEAEELLRRALVGCEPLLGGNHPDTIRIVEHLAKVSSDVGNKTGAERLYRRSFEAKRNTMRLAHPLVFQGVIDLARVLEDQDKFTESEEIRRADFEARKKELGMGHRTTLLAVSGLASVLQKHATHLRKKVPNDKVANAKLKDAEAMLRDARKAFKANMTVLAQPETLKVIHTYCSVVMQQQNRVAELSDLLSDDLEKRKKKLGKEQYTTILSMVMKASHLKDEFHNLHEAGVLLTEALALRRRYLGENNADTIAALSSLASVLEDDLQYKSSEQFRRQALEANKKLLGDSHPDTLSSIYDLASNLNKQNTPKFDDEMYKLYKQAYEGRKEALGPIHRLTLISLNKYLQNFQKAKTRSNPFYKQDVDDIQGEVLKTITQKTKRSYPDVAAYLNSLPEVRSHEEGFDKFEKQYSGLARFSRHVKVWYEGVVTGGDGAK